jgi:hypothetical protein
MKMEYPVNHFSITRRNYGHWDIEIGNGRLYAIRGGPGKYYIRDERKINGFDESEEEELPYFKTVSACMSYICDKLMYELIVVEGQEVHTIDSWNI